MVEASAQSQPRDTVSPEAAPRYVVGIDLGTTNSALAFLDTEAGTEAEARRVRRFRIPQLVAPSTVEARGTLPSFHYQPSTAEGDAASFCLPWQDGDPPDTAHVVGLWARQQGAAAPGRLVVSAKSWLSHAGVDRTADLLPWRGDDDVIQYSPSAISSRYLDHLRAAWDAAHPDHPLAEQSLVLTVPASFDEIARELTLEAARRAGLHKLLLIEEPQAAFYAWMDEHRAADQPLEPGQTVLVCDVGGGTTDLTLIEVRADAEGETHFHRVAVGDHLILGGDNLDLALAHHLEEKLTANGGRIDPRQWSVLVRRCQQAKETLLGEDAPESLTITVPAAGSRLIGGSRQVELHREDAIERLVEGFLPRVDVDARPARRQSGFRELGLPYAPDAAITRYLAAFLSAHGDSGPVRPDAVLFNGGCFESPTLRDRFLEVLTAWFDTGDGWQPRVLQQPRLDFAVAHGAACYGRVRRGQGERIRAGLAHTYYIGIEGSEDTGSEDTGSEDDDVKDGNDGKDVARAICLVPSGLEEGQEVALRDHRFELLIRQPVEFAIYTSSRRTRDRPGDVIDADPTQLTPLPPIRTVLRSGKKQHAERLDVHLHARLTELGTLEAWCGEIGGNRRWRLQFDVRSTVQTDLDAHAGTGERAGFVEEQAVERCEVLIRQAFASKNGRPDALMRQLENTTELPRGDWPPSLLRTLWQVLMEVEKGRRLSIAHEARWLNLLGYALRPGSGYAIDDWRVAQTWRLFHAGVHHRRNAMCRAEWWVLWRRIAGGLSAGQQRALADRVLPTIRARYRPPSQTAGRSSGGHSKKAQVGPHELAEMWRLLGALESLEPQTKRFLGDKSLAVMRTEGPGTTSGALLWALGRLASRQPAYGPLNAVVAAEVAENWLHDLMRLEPSGRDHAFAVLQCARRTDDRYRDVVPDAAEAAIRWLETHRAPAHWVDLVRHAGRLDAEERGLVFGDQLPRGLRLHPS